MPGVDVTVEGHEEAGRRIFAVGQRGMDMRPIFTVLSEDFSDIVELIKGHGHIDLELR